MSDVLSAMGDAQVALELRTSSDPGVIKPVGRDDYVYVIMPMHLAPR
jgi:DNA polymerase III subunit beta